jgi:hypothetical protein
MWAPSIACKSLQKPAKACKSLQKPAKACKSLQKPAKACKSLLGVNGQRSSLLQYENNCDHK